MASIQNICLLFRRGGGGGGGEGGVHKGTYYNSCMPIKREIRNLITIALRVFHFVDKGEHLILVLSCKANLEWKEICASDWLKPPISMLITLIFMCYIPNLEEAYL